MHVPWWITGRWLCGKSWGSRASRGGGNFVCVTRALGVGGVGSVAGVGEVMR